eukprot:scaffold109032_cov66-Phaeocystis_antarctica.AAC.2
MMAARSELGRTMIPVAPMANTTRRGEGGQNTRENRNCIDEYAWFDVYNELLTWANLARHGVGVVRRRRLGRLG